MSQETLPLKTQVTLDRMLIPFQSQNRFRNLIDLPSDISAYERWCQGQNIDDPGSRENLILSYLPENLVRLYELERGGVQENWEGIKTAILKKAQSLLGGVELLRQFRGLEDRDLEPEKFWNVLTNYVRLLFTGKHQQEQETKP